MSENILEMSLGTEMTLRMVRKEWAEPKIEPRQREMESDGMGGKKIQKEYKIPCIGVYMCFDII